MATIVEGNPKAPFSIATTPRCRGGRYSFPGLLYFTLDPYLIMLSVKQGGIKYHFLSLWYDSTWDWTQVSRAIGDIYIFICIDYPIIGKLNILETCIFFFFFHLNKLSHSNALPGTATIYIYIYIYMYICISKL